MSHVSRVSVVFSPAELQEMRYPLRRSYCYLIEKLRSSRIPVDDEGNIYEGHLARREKDHLIEYEWTGSEKHLLPAR